MKNSKRSGVMIAGLLLLALLAGCGSSSTSNSAPTVEQAFYVHSVVFDNNSTLMTAGYNGFGQLGDGTLTTPVPFVNNPFNLGRVSGYAAGANHTLAFSNHSTIWGWGSNLHGRLGINSNPAYLKTATTGSDAFTKYPVPFKVHNEVLSIATGWNHSLAVAGPNGSVLSWGENNFGQLGNDGGINKKFEDQPLPGAVLGENGTGTLDNIVQVAAGGSHCLALRADGTVYSWGDNQFGQLGYKTATDAAPTLYFATHPKQVPLPGTVVEIAAAGSFSAARLADGTVWAWGYNVYGQCGSKPVLSPLPTVSTQILTAPTQVKNADDSDFLATKISCGTMHMMALRADRDPSGHLVNSGEVWGWGWNQKGQLGRSTPGHDSDTLFEYLPGRATALDLIQVGGATPKASDVYAFGTVSFARINGKWYGWGDNGFGQLGKVVPTDAVPLIFTPVEFSLFIP
jgi:alpha-tubulin suppressor-like RCC1 family protein